MTTTNTTRNNRKRIGLLAVMAGSALALGSFTLGGMAHADNSGNKCGSQRDLQSSSKDDCGSNGDNCGSNDNSQGFSNGESNGHHEGDDNEDCTPVTEETTAPTEETTPKDTTPKDTTPKDTTPKDTTPKDTTATTAKATTTTAKAQSGGPVPTNAAVVAEASGSLPSTGSSQTLFLVLGLAMVLGGVIFVIMSRRPDEA
jgi:LPXTG-motif cell wall-anchored protein